MCCSRQAGIWNSSYIYLNSPQLPTNFKSTVDLNEAADYIFRNIYQKE